MQTGTVWGGSTWGLGLDEKILPQYLKEIGYKTHAIGKVRIKFYLNFPFFLSVVSSTII